MIDPSRIVGSQERPENLLEIRPVGRQPCSGQADRIQHQLPERLRQRQATTRFDGLPDEQIADVAVGPAGAGLEQKAVRAGRYQQMLAIPRVFAARNSLVIGIDTPIIG